LAKLSYDGKIYAATPALITTACKLNVENYPFDQKICKMTWGRLEKNFGLNLLIFNFSFTL
jgi:hypothetical protein